MPFIHEIQVITRGFPGAPGFTNFYFSTEIGADRTQDWAHVSSFMGQVRPLFPSRWTHETNPVGRVLEATSGILAEFSSIPSAYAGVNVGTAADSFGSGVSGAVIGWNTGTVSRGRVVRGRTFLVPLASSVYEPDGTLTAPAQTALQNASTAMLSAGTRFVIWSRPRLGVGGSVAPVLSSRIRSTVAFLSSRRT